MRQEAAYYEYKSGTIAHEQSIARTRSLRLGSKINAENSKIVEESLFDSGTVVFETCSYQSLHKLYERVSKLMFPDLSDIVPGMLSEFIQPVWHGVSDSVSSFLSLLPGISPFPIVHTSASWLSPIDRGFLVCRNVIGKWVAVDPIHLSKRNTSGRQISKLSNFLAAVNRFPSRGTGSICFDSETVYYIETDFCSDKIYIYQYNESLECLKVKCTIDSLPPGAIHVYGVHNERLIYSVGSDIYISTLEDLSQIIISSVLYPPSYSNVVSVQHVAPFVSDLGHIYYLSRGGLWKQSIISNEAECLFNDTNMSSVSISVNSSKKVMAVLRIDQQKKTYISLYDYLGGFVLSTTLVSFGAPLSVASISIDPMTQEIVLVGRSSSARTGSLVRVFPPTFI